MLQTQSILGKNVNMNIANILHRLFFQISEKEISVHAGLNLRIPCKVVHDPLNRLTNIMWSLNDEPIEGIFEIGSDKSLNIASVRKQHSGTYR